MFILFSGNEMKNSSFASTDELKRKERLQHFEPRGILSIAI